MNSNLGRVALVKKDAVSVALVDLARRDNVAVPKKDVLDALSLVYLLPIQCLWLRSYGVDFVDKYSVVVPRVNALLKKYEFNALVHAYRANYTNLYSQKTSKGRKYSLSMSDFVDFLGQVEDGVIVISVEKPQKEKPVKNSLASSLFNLFSLETSSPSPKTAVKPTPKVAVKPSPKDAVKEKPLVKGFYTIIPMTKMIVGNFYRLTSGTTKLYVWFVNANTTHLQCRDYKKDVVSISITDISTVEQYTKAVYANR